ncbi:hypothetical protein MTO96_002330 [Rhipicephalus appendiculatus]
MKPFTWKTNPAILARQETATRQVPTRQSSSRRHISDARDTSVVRGTYNATAYPCDTCRYHFDIRLNRREAFVNWFRDRDNADNHVFFLLSLLFAISLVDVPDVRLAGSHPADGQRVLVAHRAAGNRLRRPQLPVGIPSALLPVAVPKGVL